MVLWRTGVFAWLFVAAVSWAEMPSPSPSSLPTPRPAPSSSPMPRPSPTPPPACPFTPGVQTSVDGITTTTISIGGGGSYAYRWTYIKSYSKESKCLPGHHWLDRDHLKHVWVECTSHLVDVQSYQVDVLNRNNSSCQWTNGNPAEMAHLLAEYRSWWDIKKTSQSNSSGMTVETHAVINNRAPWADPIVLTKDYNFDKSWSAMIKKRNGEVTQYSFDPATGRTNRSVTDANGHSLANQFCGPSWSMWQGVWEEEAYEAYSAFHLDFHENPYDAANHIFNTVPDSDFAIPATLGGGPE